MTSLDKSNSNNTISSNYSQKKYLFNPFEIFFCGYSGSGKTTLIEKLTKILSKKYRIGYIKHDAHKFKMDHEGKDSYRLYEAGAQDVFINDKQHFAKIKRGALESIDQKKVMIASDIVFIEGYKYDTFPKIIVIDENKEILNDYQLGKITNVIAFVGTENPEIDKQIPYFERDNISEIEAFILNYINTLIKKIPLYGLVLTGGKSTRMKSDKSKLIYHGKTQEEYCFELLSKYCDQVFISSVKEKASENSLAKIHDTFLDMGPIGGILSALRAYPDTAFFVLACDMPFVNDETIKTLISKRNALKFATSYVNKDNDLPEPLCCIYEAKIKGIFFDYLSVSHYCPRKVLINSEVELVKPNNNIEMNNVNYPDEYIITQDILGNRMENKV